jgi:putative hydrolase of the HAD superfamily
MSRDVKAVIFDCFGVLITDALKLICDELYARDPAACQSVKDLIRATNLGIIDPAESNEQIAAILGISVEDFRAQIVNGEVKDEALMNYIAEDLRPRYKIAMMSNIAGSSLRRRFTSEELDRCFDAVVASGDIGYAKPQPEAYETAAGRLEVRYDECVFVDDREHFCEAARAVGMQAIRYDSFDQFKKDLEGMTQP